jgi:hypothetical protein
MTVHNPDVGEIFYDTDRESRMQYVGRDSTGRYVMERLNPGSDGKPSFLLAVEPDYARENLVTWTEELITLGRGQVWARTRNDYSDRAAVILVTFEYGNRDERHPQGGLYVVYEEINTHGTNPKMKREIDFRRVYGKLIDGGNDQA